MEFDLKTTFVFSGEITSIKENIETFVEEHRKALKEKEASLDILDLKKNILSLKLTSTGSLRPHNMLLHLKNLMVKEFGKKYHLGIREIKIDYYKIVFEIEKKPLKKVVIPFADLKIEDRLVTMSLLKVDDEFLRRNYIDRMIKLVEEKVKNQYYEGKGEYWELIWESRKKESVWRKDPTEEMLKKSWLKQGPTKGKWFYYPQAAAIIRAMEEIAIKEVLEPLNFQEIIESHIVPFDIWLKTGHMRGMPGEFYYVTEPKTRNVEKWEKFVDLVKITKNIPLGELEKNLEVPRSGICYAQCPMIYWSLQGKTISEDSLPILIYEKTAISARYESGGRHGIERVDEFHRIEPVYIGTKKQLLSLREKLIERYKHVFDELLDLEWRMAWVTPWYMQQSGRFEEQNSSRSREKGTIDFEAYMPYRGERDKSEWLEFQNLSIIGEKYVKAFNIKTQKEQLWSGCSGIGLERWAVAFLAQKGLNPEKWPSGFKKYLNKVPEGIRFL